MRRLLGVKDQKDVGEDKKKNGSKVSKLKVDEMLLINIGSTSLGGKIIRVKSDICRI